MRLRAAFLALVLVAVSGFGATAETQLSAEFDTPTDRYGHGAVAEWAGLEITMTVDRPGFSTLARTVTRRSRLDLTEQSQLVFEDVAPRLWDVDSDGVDDIVVVQAHETRGARLLVLGWVEDPGMFAVKAATDFVGERNHWLAPVGMADFDGDGFQDLAYVDAPHRLGELVLARYREGALEEMARYDGFSNHHFGENRILGGLRDCAGQPELVLARFDWSALVALSFEGLALRESPLGHETSAAAFAAALGCS